MANPGSSNPSGNPKSPVLLLAAAVILAAGVIGYFALRPPGAAPEASVAPPTAAAPAPAPPSPAPPQPSGPPGMIRGVVRLSGPAPEMPLLKRGADPVCAATPVRDQEVVVTGDKIANAVVRIARGLPPSAPAPTTAPVEIGQHQCMYEPRVVATLNGTRVEVKNGDATLHNIHAYLGTKTLFNRAQPPGSPPVEYTPTEGGALITFKCDVHPWMRGYVYVNQNPFVKVTPTSGEYQLDGVPPGTYTLEAWHERFGTKTAEVTVPPGGSVEADFTFGG